MLQGLLFFFRNQVKRIGFPHCFFRKILYLNKDFSAHSFRFPRYFAYKVLRPTVDFPVHSFRFPPLFHLQSLASDGRFPGFFSDTSGFYVLNDR